MRAKLHVLLLVLLVAGSGRGAWAQQRVTEGDLKAAFLYNFIKFVDWPPEGLQGEGEPFAIGVLGDDEFAQTLQTALSDKRAHGRPIIVRKAGSAAEAAQCELLYVRESELRRMSSLSEALKGAPILTVGETEQFLEYGGMIALSLEDKQLRFQVNLAPAEQSKLTISSKLLRLAKRVRKGAGK